MERPLAVRVGKNLATRREMVTYGLEKAECPLFLSFHDNAFVQAVLETALLDKLPAEVAYYETGNAGPVKILAATVSAGPPGCPHKDCVERVTCVANGECAAQITGVKQGAKTKEIRALGVLLTAVNKKKPVEYLSLDASHSIVRVKINVPSS